MHIGKNHQNTLVIKELQVMMWTDQKAQEKIYQKKIDLIIHFTVNFSIGLWIRMKIERITKI